MNYVDRTIILNSTLPKKWKCPHCGKTQSFDKQDDEIFIRFMRIIRHCENCCYLHVWELQLTDDFKRKVIRMMVDGAERKEE